MLERGQARIRQGADSVEVTGDADLNSADELDAAIAGVAGSNQRVFVDLTRTTLLDSRIISVLISWAERLKERGGGLPLVCPDPDIRRIFEVMGLDREFEFVSSR